MECNTDCNNHVFARNYSTLADSSTTGGTVNLNKFGFQPEAIVGELWKISTQIHM
jgi:hypothetical protein